MNKSLIIFFIFILLQYPASGFTPVMDTPYNDMYYDTENMELLTLYTEIAALEQQYNAAVTREQSLGNRILGAVAIGMGGIGGMQMASALAEQRADENAMRDMTAYIATFKCDYGMGMNVTGGEINVQLPGADALLQLRGEYIALADELKIRKELLGMSPGIERDIISNATESGLYNNASIGKTDGAYTSVYSALTDTDGDDADAWAAQQSETASQLKTGAVVGGVGVAGATVGNVIENITHNKQSNDTEHM